MKIISYFSKKYSKEEKNYTVVEKEVLAILTSVIHFKPIIYAAKITIFTDNKILTFSGDISKRINRWKLMLEEYDYKIVHIDGNLNSEADILSRSIHANIIENYYHDLPEFPFVKLEQIRLSSDSKEQKLQKIYNIVGPRGNTTKM